ncbi:hypothetical protein AX17_000927 [Amanita inopinata Kibby_2008]|nr:hypothetical protein AX17_000927 [Amanita inopinata Kibby_2008]
MLRRAEEACAENFSLVHRTDNASDTGSDTSLMSKSTPSVEVVPFLPSPPASSPTSQSSPSSAKQDRALASADNLCINNAQERKRRLPPHPSTPRRAQADPSFRSLSSPADSLMSSPAFHSPTLSHMISDAMDTTPSPLYTQNSHISPSSPSSQEFVEQQLTQSINERDDQQSDSSLSSNVSLENRGFASRIGMPLPSSQINEPASTRSISPVTAPLTSAPSHSFIHHRQAWYQNRPRRQSLKATSVSIPSVLEQPLVSGQNPAIPSASQTLEIEDSHSTEEWSQSLDPEAPTHDDFQSFPYQTQAPYHSQP